MKTLYWDSGDPLDCYDNPNCFFDATGIGRRRERGDSGYVEWYPPGYTPPPPPPKKKKPFRRKASTQTDPQPTTPPTTMPTFKYTTRQNPQGGFTTRIALGSPIGDEALLSLIATTAGVTTPQAEAVLRAFATHLLGCSSGCDYSRKFLGLYAFQPTSGGSAPSPDGFHNPADINADIAITLTRETIENWQGTLTLEHLGEVGLVTPLIDSMINQATGALNVYTAGDLMQVRGNNLKFDRTDTQQGLFLTGPSGTEVRCTVYADIEPLSFTFLVPAGTTGAQSVRMAARINGSLRSYTYNATISAA